MIELEKWNDRPSAFGLPKVKSLKIKMKKAKAEKAEGRAVPATPAAAPPAPAAEKKIKTPPEKK